MHWTESLAPPTTPLDPCPPRPGRRRRGGPARRELSPQLCVSAEASCPLSPTERDGRNKGESKDGSSFVNQRKSLFIISLSYFLIFFIHVTWVTLCHVFL